jgi:chemotaxis protein MotB
MGQTRRWHFLGMAWLLVGPLGAGCAIVPRVELDRCQAYNRQLLEQNRQLAAELQRARQEASRLASERAALQQQVAQNQTALAQYEQRIREYDQERSQFEQMYQELLAGMHPQQGHLTPEVRRQLEAFAIRHPEFVEVDAERGISKFKSDVLFPLGQAELSPEARAVLQEFASIFKSAAGQPFNLFIVGHTDDRPIVKPETRAKHPTNWHLSVHRAIAVQQFLEQSGIEARRMGVSGYGEHQPLVPNDSEENRARNRRVEIFVLNPRVPAIGMTQPQSVL